MIYSNHHTGALGRLGPYHARHAARFDRQSVWQLPMTILLVSRTHFRVLPIFLLIVLNDLTLNMKSLRIKLLSVYLVGLLVVEEQTPLFN